MAGKLQLQVFKMKLINNNKIPKERKRNDIQTTNNNRPHKFVRVELGDNVNHFVVDKIGILMERFFDLVHVSNTDSLTLKEELYQVLSYHNLNIENLRGQGYDGASNMRREFNGLKALILKHSPCAYYVHCFAHRLQLALIGATKEVIPIQLFFIKLAIIVNIVDDSSKRHDELHTNQQSEIAHNVAHEG